MSDLLDANGKPFDEIHAELGEVEIIIPPETIARAFVDVQLASAAPSAQSIGAMQRLEKLASSGFMQGIMGVAVGALLGMAYQMYGRFAPGLEPPTMPAGLAPTDYALSYLTGMVLRAASARRWRLEYDIAGESSLVVTRLTTADTAPDRGAQAQIGAPARDAGEQAGSEQSEPIAGASEAAD